MKILHWNSNFSSSLLGSSSSRKKAEAILPFIQGYDVVILNEIWAENAKNIFSIQYPYSYRGSRGSWKIFDGGILILSQHPLSTIDFLEYSVSAGWDWFATKGIISFFIQLNEETYQIFVTNIQTGYTYKEHMARRVQIKEISSYVKEKSLKGYNSIIMGNFNVMSLLDDKMSDQTHDMMDALSRDIEYKFLLDNMHMPNINHGGADRTHIFTDLDNIKVENHSVDGLEAEGYIALDL